VGVIDARPEATPIDAGSVAPILPARDFERTARFYERLGFTVVSQYQAPDAYLILRQARIELHFFPHFDLDPASSYAGCYIRVAEVGAWFESARAARLPEAGIPRLVPLSDRPWGMREFAIIDPDGSLLRIGTPSR
jgi:catechol 2,3-dioxygenase-like lactoylglutathione lyase family enzyme